MNYDLASIAPEIFLCSVGLAVLFGEIILSENQKKWLVFVSLFGMLITLLLNHRLFSTYNSSFYGMFEVSSFSCFFKDVLLVAGGLVILLYHPYNELKGVHAGEFLSLLLFSIVGMMFMVSATDFLMMFLAMEFVSIISYILVGFIRKDLKSNEGALKYFLVGSFCSAIMVYGISFIYGLTGSTNFSSVARDLFLEPSSQMSAGGPGLNLLLILSVLFILAGLGFKLAMVPFHTWAPDAFEGAPTPVTAFISVAPKAAGIAIVIRVFQVAFPLDEVNVKFCLAILSAASMIAGNLMAIPQNNIKRLLAYSSIGHIGYILIGVVAADKIGMEGVLVYILAYILMNIGAFACAIAISNRIGSDEIEDYAGMSQRAMPLSLIFVVFLLSLAGIPPTAGFVGKFLVFAAAIKTGYVWLAVIGILNSVISVYYYFRIAYYIYFKEPREDTGAEVSLLLNTALISTAVMIFLIGIFPNSFIGVAQECIARF